MKKQEIKKNQAEDKIKINPKEKYEPVFGLEVHIELSTSSKMFCSCPADHFAAPPNTQTCPICLGLPGTLPFANQKAIEDTIKFGLALGCKINTNSRFDRKHYFYPDLPKGYQISQYELPLCKQGTLMGIDITRIHLEEDTAKLVHKDANSLIDFNRSGVPLMELVTEPDFKDIETTISFLKEIQLIVRHLNISTGDLEKGSMRLEANISVRLKGTKSLPTYKVELKNINSFKFLYKALQAEIKRQIQLLSKGITPTQETRGFNQTSGKTFSQRTKEEAQDYRYFPEPDIPTLFLSEKLITSLKKNLPLLPEKIRSNFMTDFNLPQNYIETLLKEPQRTIFFQKAAALATSHKISPLEIAKVMVNQSLDKKFDQPESLVKKLLSLQNRSTSSQEEVDQAAKKVLSQNKKAVEDFQKGQTQVVGFLIGQIQKILKGKGDPKLIRNTLISLLQK